MKKNVKIICCENVGENKTLEENCMKNFKEIKFEFTSPGTSQKNVSVEQGFYKICSRMRVMMTHSGLHKNLKTGLWPECAANATKIENIMVNPYEEKYAHENLYRKIPDYTKYLRTFGEMGFVCSIAMVKEKLEDQQKTSMLLGYA